MVPLCQGTTDAEHFQCMHAHEQMKKGTSSKAQKQNCTQGQHTMNPFQVYYAKINVDPEGIGDDYSPYNKPYGVMSWLQDTDPVGDYFLIVDADMTFHRCG